MGRMDVWLDARRDVDELHDICGQYDCVVAEVFPYMEANKVYGRTVVIEGDEANLDQLSEYLAILTLEGGK